MKKLILSILTFLYIFGTTGTTLSAHYCMGRLADWSFGHSKEDTCGRCGMEKTGDRDNGCCSDQETFVKNTEDQKPGSDASPTVPPPADLLAYYPVHHRPLMVACGSIVFSKHAPPGTNPIPRYILISAFRI